MRLVFKKVRETKNWAVYQVEDGTPDLMPKSQLYFIKRLDTTLVFDLVESTTP